MTPIQSLRLLARLAESVGTEPTFRLFLDGIEWLVGNRRIEAWADHEGVCVIATFMDKSQEAECWDITTSEADIAAHAARIRLFLAYAKPTVLVE